MELHHRLKSSIMPANLIKMGLTYMMNYKKYMCLLCGLIYDEEKGWPEEGIAPGTRWEDVPPAWQCPECGATKDDFEMMEMTA